MCKHNANIYCNDLFESIDFHCKCCYNLFYSNTEYSGNSECQLRDENYRIPCDRQWNSSAYIKAVLEGRVKDKT